MLKSRIHWRAGLGKLAKAVVECAGVGVCTSDYGAADLQERAPPDLPARPGHDLAEELMAPMIPVRSLLTLVGEGAFRIAEGG